MADLTSEMRAEMRFDAEAAAKRSVDHDERCVSVDGAAQLTLLDYCDRLERERDEARENANNWEACTHQLEDQCEEEHRTAESALAAAHERMREMAEALEPFADDFYHEKRPDSEELTVYRGPKGPYTIGDFRRAARVLADYRKGNADPADRSRTSEGGGAT